MPESTGRSDFKISLKLLWGTKERAPRGPKPALTVAQIVETAIELADAEGIESVSMRKVADRLKTKPMSLYRYVPSKAELLDLMLDTVHAEHATQAPPKADDWRTRLEWHAHQSRGLIQRHPWMLHVSVGQRPPLGPNIIATFDLYLEAVAGIGLTPQEMIAATELVGNYVQGATRATVEAVELEQETGITDEQWWTERSSFWEDYFDPERFPHISAIWDAGGYEDPLDAFDFGLQRILDGIEALLASR